MQHLVKAPNSPSELEGQATKSVDQPKVTSNIESRSSDEPCLSTPFQQKYATLPRSFGSRAPTSELDKLLKGRLRKENDPNALDDFESKVRRNTLERKSDDQRKQDVSVRVFFAYIYI